MTHNCKAVVMSQATQHPFEATGCGIAPFRVVGFQKLTFQAAPGGPVKAGGSCDHCGTAIKNAYVIREAGGNTFRVGSSCVAKAGDSGLLKGMKAVDKKRRAAAKVAKQRTEVAELLTELGDILWHNREILDMPLSSEDFRTFRNWFTGSDARRLALLPQTRDVRLVDMRVKMAKCQVYKAQTGNEFIWIGHVRNVADRAQWDAQMSHDWRAYMPL